MEWYTVSEWLSGLPKKVLKALHRTEYMYTENKKLVKVVTLSHIESQGEISHSKSSDQWPIVPATSHMTNLLSLSHLTNQTGQVTKHDQAEWSSAISS